MDDDDDHDFSKSIVWNYFEQAETTFGSMDKALWVVVILFKSNKFKSRNGLSLSRFQVEI